MIISLIYLLKHNDREIWKAIYTTNQDWTIKSDTGKPLGTMHRMKKKKHNTKFGLKDEEDGPPPKTETNPDDHEG